MQKTGEDRAYLENQATDARLRLEQRLRALLERRRHWTATARRVTHPPTTALLIAALGLTAIVLIARSAQPPRRQGTWRPEILALLRAPPISERGFFRQTLEKTARALLTDAGRKLGHRGVQRFLFRPPNLAEAGRQA